MSSKPCHYAGTHRAIMQRSSTHQTLTAVVLFICKVCVKLDTEPFDDDVVHVQHIANILLTDNYTAQ